MDNKELINNTKNALKFIDNLYLEISFLFREIETLLHQQDEMFCINKASGYAVTTRTSTGLETYNVANWLSKRFTVYFTPETMTKVRSGQTHTDFNDKLRIIFCFIDISPTIYNEPIFITGFIEKISCKKPNINKFENLMYAFAYQSEKILENFNIENSINNIKFDDTYCSFIGQAFFIKLFSIKNNTDIKAKIIDPLINIYRK